MRAFGCYKVEATGELETDGMCAYGRTGGSLHRMVMIWTPPNTLEPDARVMELIDFEKQCWREELVKQVFLSFEAEQIIAIPLP